MASSPQPLLQNLNQELHFMLSKTHPKPTFKTSKKHFHQIQCHKLFISTRRTTTLVTLSTAALSMLLLPTQPTFSNDQKALAFDLRMTVPDQTLEEAEREINGHAESLLGIRGFLEKEAWNDAQKLLRKSSSLLKQDIYTIIQGKPGAERPLLRKLYSNLFGSVTRLDYAARDKDLTRVWECYQNIVVALNDILSRV